MDSDEESDPEVEFFAVVPNLGLVNDRDADQQSPSVESPDSDSEGDTLNNTVNQFEEVADDADYVIGPGDHSYLGFLNEVHGCRVVDDESNPVVPLVFPPSPVILVPGQVLPFIEVRYPAISAMKFAIENNTPLGVVHATTWHTGCKYSDIVGCTADILEWARTEQDGYKVKTIGRQRFRLRYFFNRPVGDESVLLAVIKILKECTPSPVLKDAKLPSLDKSRRNNKKRCMDIEANMTQWPSWVYRQYDTDYLIQEIKKCIPSNANIKFMGNPTDLSYQLLKLIPMKPKLITWALNLNSTVQRLRWELSVMKSLTPRILCVRCSTIISYERYIMSMAEEGPQGTYVNPQGYIHEIITLRKVRDVKLSGSPSIEHSWFPGYSWTILICGRCLSHLGWKFIAQSANAKPRVFWGIRHSALTTPSKVELSPDNESSNLTF